MWYEPGACVVCIYRGVISGAYLWMDVRLCLLDVLVVWFSPDSVLEMHLHLMRKYCYRYVGAVPYVLAVRCSPRGSCVCKYCHCCGKSVVRLLGG
jgi:hypothetical protein